MKTFMEIASEAKALNKMLNKIGEEKRELLQYWKDGIDENDHEKLMAAFNRREERLKEIRNIEIRENLRMKFLNANAKYVLVEECLPVIIEVLTKYKGKSYGEKTKEKISREMEEKLNIRFYISGECWRFWHLDYRPYGYDVEINGPSYDKPLMIGNKIQIFPKEKLHVSYKTKYTEDIDAGIDAFLVAYNEVYEAREAYSHNISVLNSLNPDVNKWYTEKETYRPIFYF